MRFRHTRKDDFDGAAECPLWVRTVNGDFFSGRMANPAFRSSRLTGNVTVSNRRTIPGATVIAAARIAIA